MLTTLNPGSTVGPSRVKDQRSVATLRSSLFGSRSAEIRRQVSRHNRLSDYDGPSLGGLALSLGSIEAMGEGQESGGASNAARG
jgi:hypothetical protein